MADGTKTLFIRVPADLHAALAQLAAAERRSLTAQVEIMLAKLLDERTAAK